MSYFLAKVEILKAICMYEYGQINTFLESLKNSLNFFYKNDFSSLKTSISWSKHSEINYNKFFIQNYLSRYTGQLIDFLFILLKDKSEIVLLSSLKTMEFLIDYYIHNLSQYIPKLVKVLFKLLSPLKRAKNANEKCNEELWLAFNSLKSSFNTKGIFFPDCLFEKYLGELDVYNIKSRKINRPKPKRRQTTKKQ